MAGIRTGCATERCMQSVLRFIERNGCKTGGGGSQYCMQNLMILSQPQQGSTATLVEDLARVDFVMDGLHTLALS